MDREDVTNILKDCGHFPEIGISILVQQSLVTVDRKNKIGMHDLLRDMGREIVRKQSKERCKEPTRLWRYEDVHELSKDTSTFDVKGLTLKMSRMDSPTYLETKAFEKMDKLRLLQLSGVQLDGDYKYLSRHLRWLSWHRFPLKFTPADFHQRSLVAVDLKYSNLEQVWRKSQLLVKLKILNLSHSHNLRHTPDFSNLPNLEKLILKDCPSLSSVSSNIGQLKKILLINLKDCTGLRELPRSIYKLDSVKTLILSGCTKIDKLEEDIEQMKSLTTLVADNTAIARVPFAVVRSKSIAYISLCGYEGFGRKVFPSIIQSWLSPTNSILSLVQTFAGTSCLDITDEQNNNFYCLSSIFEDLQDLQRLWLKCDSEAQLNQTVASILYSFNTQNCEGFSNIGTSASIRCHSQVCISSSKKSLTSLLIQMGMSCDITNILRENILQHIESGLLPGDNYPDWLTFNSNSSSVTFEIPQVYGRSLKTIMCIAYSSSPNNTITDGFDVLLVINYTKNSIQVYKRDELLDSSDEEEWQRVIANIEPGNKIEVVVVFTNEFTVKKTTIYLVYDEPIQERTNHCHEPDENTQIDKLEEDIQQTKSLTTLVVDSTAITKTQMYDVFLSFRGEDCCPKFISHLDSSLQNAGIVVFKDNHGIHRGDQILVSLLQAISQSRICIVVLSTNYANSTWCMVELERIVEISRIKGGLVVVPVFYEVDPWDVRNQTGMFGEEFDSLISTKKVDEKTKRIWKAALNEVGGRAGGVVIKNSRNESEAIKKIVELVTLFLDKTELFVADHPVGLKSRVQDVIQLLNSQKSKEPLLLGIWGMGGIGKTTIAKAVYNEIHHDFEAKSFLLNVRESWKLDSDKVALQQQLLSDIYKIKKIKIDTVKSGKMILQERLCEKKIFIVIDDVDNLDQMNALCGNRKWFGEGSRIIITTRNEDLLGRLEVDHVYRMKEMDDSESLELFNWHAFKQPIPRAGFTNLSRDVVKYSGGLPLALQVIGSFLLTRRREAEWKSVLEKLNLIPNVEVTEKLKISFDCLKDDVKDIFLDIAFFFIGMDREDVTEILKDCGNFPEIGISVLIQQSLVTVDRKNKIEMHDLLRSMGREIVRKKSIEGGKEPSRLWRYEDVLELSKDTSTLDVKGLTFKMSRMDSTTYLETKAFEKMDKLRFLQLSGVQLVGDYKYLSKELKWLSWHGFPLKFIPADFYQDNLVAVELKYSNLERVWRESQLLVKLKILNLSHSHNLRHTPDFSNLPNLEKLILKDCPSLSSVSSNIGQLKKILLINLKDCRGLRKLPRSIYKLDSLKTLILSGCTKIDKLEEDIEQMKSLTTLVADKTAITRVPFAVVRLKSIAYISLCDFEGFTRTVFPSIIKSWLSPTNKILSLVQTFAGTLCLDITDEQNNNFYCLSSIFEHLQDLHCLWLKCDSEAQLNQTVASILYSFNTQNCEGFSIIGTSASIQSRIQASISSSKNSLTSFLIQMGVSCNVANILRENILQKMPRVGTGLLPGDNYPDWLTFNSSGSSVTFEAPQVVGRSLKTIMCIAYSLAPDKNIIEGFKVVLVINCTKNIIQVYKIGALLASFDDDEWQRVISNIEPGNEIKVVVVFTNEFIVKETTIYLVYDEPIEEKTNHRHEADENGVVSSNVLNIFGRHFCAIPSLARTVLTSRPFWFCLAGIMVWSSRRHSEKRGRDNPILREVASTSSQVFNSPESLDKNPLVDLQEVKRIG